MSKKFLRPPAQYADSDEEEEEDEEEDEELLDDDDDDDDDDEEDDGAARKPAKGAKKRPAKGGGGGGKPRKKPKAASFFDIEAEASDDEDEEEDYRGRHNAKDEQMDDEAMEIIRQQDRRRAQAGGRFAHLSVEQLSKQIEDRHRMQRTTVSRHDYVDRRPPPRQAPPPQARREEPRGGGGGGGAREREREDRGGGDRDRKSGGGGGVGAREDRDRGSSGGDRGGRMPPPAAPPRAREMIDDDDDDYSDGGADMGRGGGAMIDDVGGSEVYTAVAQQSLVPSVSDPSLWMVSCAGGKEQELVYQIMNKCVAFARQGRPLGISAAIAAQSKGKIYIESFSEPAVMEAVQGVRGLMQYTMKLVPIGDMTTVMTVATKKKPVKKNEWVRMSRGHYKGDLALVTAVKESGLKCIVQCVPRLDFALSDLPPEEARIRRRTVRPPQKFFNVQELASMGKQSLRRQRFPGLDIYCDYFEGNYYHDGYLMKEMTVGSMIKPCTDDDPPSLDELQKFQRRKTGDGYDDDDGADNEGSKMAASLLDELSELQGKTGLGKTTASSGGLLVGDTIEVIEGDLVGMRGKLVSMDGTTVKIRPINTSVDLGGMDEVEFLANQVRKYIPVGAHVKVTDGRYANETGTVVAVEKMDGETDFTAVVLTDVTNKEISVRTSQLRESAEVASGQDKLQGYELYDLVVLSGGGSANEVGVIVRVGREDFTVINNHGIAREVRPEELRGKRNSTSQRAVALDVQGNQIRCGDSVNVAEGPHKGKTATIKRMSRAQLFLHSQVRSEHAGVFVVRSRSCVLAGTRSQSRGSAPDGGVSPFATPQSQSRGGPMAKGGRKDDGLVGKTVRVQAGQWKGYIGTVSDSTATHVQVELHSRLKKVMVVRERVVVVGDKFGATEDGDQGNAEPAPIQTIAMTTPMHQVGGATPAIHGFGGATPSHTSEETDEVWRPGGTIDQETKNDGWGTSTNEFGASNNDENNEGGWGSSAGTSSNAWGASQPKKEEDDGVAIKSESDLNDTDETPTWFMERVCVQLRSQQDKAGVIKEINSDKSALVELDDKSTTTVRARDLSMVPPKEHDTVLVTGGNEIGLEGSLVCVDGSDAILKDANDEFKIIDFVHLVKIAS